MKKKAALIAVFTAALLLFLGIGIRFYCSSHIFISGVPYPRDSESLTLAVSGPDDLDALKKLTGIRRLDLGSSTLTADQFDALQEALPDCRIFWQVPFQQETLANTVREIQVSALSEKDLEMLDYFPDLTAVDGSGCTDYPQLLQLRQNRPDLSVSYQVSLGGQNYDQDTSSLSLQQGDPEELLRTLPFLPDLRQVEISDPVKNFTSMITVVQTYPSIRFEWCVDVFGKTVDTDAEELDLSGISMTDTGEVEALLPCFPHLQKVDMCGCGIASEEMEALNLRHPETLFVWTVKVGPLTVRTDAQTFMPTREGYRVYTRDCFNLRYCTELIALDLGHMDVSNCDFVAFMPHLKYCILADTLIKDFTPLTDLKELVFLEIFLTDITDYSPLLTLTGLEDLNISYTFGDWEIISQMTWLKRLWWVNGACGSPDYMKEKMPDTKMQFTGLSSTGRGWRRGGHYFDMRDCFGMPYTAED